MTIKKLTMEFGAAHVIARVEFTDGGGEATVVGMENGDQPMAWTVDAAEGSLAEIAQEVVQAAFTAVLDALMGPDLEEQPAEGKADGQ